MIRFVESDGHGAWNSREHSGVRAQLYLRGIGLLRTERLLRSASPALCRIQREAVNLPSTARLVMRFATPYCTPDHMCASRVAFLIHTEDNGDGSGTLLRRLLRRGGIDPDYRLEADDGTNRQQSLLCFAAQHSNVPSLLAIIDAGASLDMRGDRGTQTALHVASTQGHAEIVALLLERGASVDISNRIRRPEDGDVALFMAVRAGCTHDDAVPHIIRALLAAGAEIDRPGTKSRRRRTALGEAVYQCDSTAARGAAVVEVLLGHGASMERAGRSMAEGSLLHRVCCASSAACLRVLLAHGADPDARAPISGKTALICATERANAAAAETVEVLLEAGARPDPDDDLYGAAALFIAAKLGNVRAVRALLARGAEVNRVTTEAKTRISGTALFVATMEGRVDVVALLLRKGACATIRGKVGGGPSETPLDFARRCRRVDVLKLLERTRA
tara:strand:- start:387 stop:1730 length:1344 start_codon:yes stop_codon:yes gene_type:complete